MQSSVSAIGNPSIKYVALGHTPDLTISFSTPLLITLLSPDVLNRKALASNSTSKAFSFRFIPNKNPSFTARLPIHKSYTVAVISEYSKVPYLASGLSSTNESVLGNTSICSIIDAVGTSDADE